MGPDEPVIVVIDTASGTAEQVLEAVSEHYPDSQVVGADIGRECSDHAAAIVIVDLTVLEGAELERLEQLRCTYPHALIIVTTVRENVEKAVECLRLGAFDYLSRPFEVTTLVAGIRRALRAHAFKEELVALRDALLKGGLRDRSAFTPIVTQSRKMLGLFQYVEAIRHSREPVLITGETGTGKELLAQAVHEVSGVRGSLMAVNVAGLDDTIFSDTLFGHRRGAYTGAQGQRKGLIAQATGGTLFLDEIGDMSATTQTKLLRLLQEEEYYPLGSDRAIQSNIRTIAATNEELEVAIGEGRFRMDLFYRLKTHHIHVPPLRERREDVPWLFNLFLAEACQALGKRKPTVPPELFSLLSSYHFPGNVRELQSMVFDATARHTSRMLSMDTFKTAIESNVLVQPTGTAVVEEDDESTLIEIFGRFPTLKEAERYLVLKSMEMADHNQGIAASMLGISRQALNRRLKKLKQPQQS